jgi:cobalt/nickel transport system permease protein
MLSKPVQLHIPDGFLSTPIAIIGWIAAIIFIGIALRQTRNQLGEKQIPLMGVLAAFIFAGQAMNFPVAGGTTGHLLGSTLAVIVLGPWAAVLVMASVVSVQGLIFQDGGLFALGFNLTNMAVIAPFIAHFVYQAVRRTMGDSRTSLFVGAAAASWLSIMLGASAIAMELAVSGTSPIGVALPAMAAVHALLGVAEALITIGALAFLLSTRRDLLNIGKTAPGKTSASWVGVGLGIAIVVALLSPLASPDPDGLSRVAIDQGFEGLEVGSPFEIFADYSIPFIGDGLASGLVAMVVGTLVVFGLVFVVARLQRRKTSATP